MTTMKDSGLPWVKDVPQSWNNETIRHLMVGRDGGAWGNEPNDEYSGTVCLRIADFEFNKGRFKSCDEDDLTRREYPATQAKRLALRTGDILIEKSGGGEKTPVGRAVYYAGEYGPVLYANFMERLRFDSTRVDSEFVEYWLRAWYACRCSPYYINQTTGIQNINLTLMLAKERIFFPHIDSQRLIVKYLDKRCAEIDKTSEEIQQQIEILEQYKRSIITETVTKGLDSSVPMKESGAGWMPLVPAHWKVHKLKYHLSRRTVRNPGDAEVLSLYRELGVVPKDSRDDNYNVTSEDTSNYLFVRKGDFVINKMKAWQGSVAVSEYEGIVSPAYFVYEFKDALFHKRYFHYLLRNRTYAIEFMRMSGGIRVGQWDLPASALENTFVLIPPINEQKNIASFLDKKCADIELVIDEKKRQLEVIEEYKKSIIFEYVTGKKEVPSA